MTAPMNARHRRRTLSTVAGLAIAVCVALAGCAGTGAGAEGEAGDGGSFSFTDDRGETVKLNKSKLRVVAQEDAANALMHLGIKPVGIFGGAPLSKNPMLEGLDTKGIESVGEVFGEVKMEKLVKLRPDVIVSTYYTGDGVLFPGGVYGFKSKKMQDDAKRVAPILAINSTKPSSTVIERFGDLAKAMGADVTGGKVATHRKAYQAAVRDLKVAAKEHADLDVLAVTPAQDQVYFAVPDAFPDLLDLEQWGVKVMTPDGKLVSSYYEAVSWENAAKYQPDVVLVDVRGYTLGTEALKKYPTWNELKAVKTGQVGEWVRVSLSYQEYAKRIKDLTAVLNDAESV